MSAGWNAYTGQRDMFENVGGQIRPRDVCARKHGGNEQSKAAFDSVSHHISDAQRSVWINIYDCRGRGVTCDELSERMGTTPNAISGRITELRMMGKIEKRGTRKTRSGCSAAVWVAI